MGKVYAYIFFSDTRASTHFDGDNSMNTLSNMVFYLILICGIFARGHGGYIYPRPATPFELPAKVNIEKQETAADDPSSQYESAVSFSVPLEDYNFLKEHKAEYHNSPFNDPHAADVHTIIHNSQIKSSDAESVVLQKIEGQPDTVIEDLNTIHETAIGNGENIIKENLDGTKNILLHTRIPIHNNEVVPSAEVPIVNQIVTNFDSQHLVQTAVPQVESIYENGPAREQNNFRGQITRDIYFHVPPPDLEEPQVIRLPEHPKKIYKIIFIKVPAQYSSSTAQLQQAIYNQIAPVQDKTLIYVLVKKPEPIPILPPPKPTPSEHEVLFVKYRDNRVSDLPVASGLLQRSVRDGAKALLPGRVNGQP